MHRKTGVVVGFGCARGCYTAGVDIARLFGADSYTLGYQIGALPLKAHEPSNPGMGRRAHPLRDRAMQLMRAGQATPEEIAKAVDLLPATVQQWRRRAQICTHDLRIARVRRLMMRGQANGETGEAE